MSTSTSQSVVKDNLIAGGKPVVTETSIVLTAPGADTTYARGTVIALDSVTGKLVPYSADGEDGAEVFYGVLAEETVFLAAEGDKSVVDYIAGHFNIGSLVFTGTGDAATIKADARTKGVFLEQTANNDSIAPA